MPRNWHQRGTRVPDGKRPPIRGDRPSRGEQVCRRRVSGLLSFLSLPHPCACPPQPTTSGLPWPIPCATLSLPPAASSTPLVQHRVSTEIQSSRTISVRNFSRIETEKRRPIKAGQLDFQSTLSVQLRQGVRIARSPTGVFVTVVPRPTAACSSLLLRPAIGQVRSGQVRYITRPKSRTVRVTRQLGQPPKYRRV